MEKIIVGLAGVKRSGKDTVAGMIKEVLPNSTQHALADKLKNVCSRVYSIPRDFFDNQDIKELPLEKPKRLTVHSIDEICLHFGIEATLEEINRILGDVINTRLTTPREIAQIVGTEVLRRFCGEDVHCVNLPIDSEITIVSDLRFPNEYRYFNDLANKDVNIKFIPLYIKRDIAEQEVTEKSHSSEKSVFQFSNNCLLIDNNGSFDDTRKQIHTICEKIEGYLD